MTAKPRKFLLLTLFALSFFFPCLGRAEDCWISVSGSGSKNGVNAFNAYSASDGAQSKYAQICWNQTSPDGTMHVMAGEYTSQNGAFWRLRMTSARDGSGATGKTFKKLIGEGEVLLRGPRRVPYDPSRKAEGGGWVEITQRASRIWIQNFHVSQVAEAISAKEGGNALLRFQDLYFNDTRQNFVILGHPGCADRRSCRVQSSEISRDILIENTWGIRYSKRHVRLSHGVSRVRVVNSHADAGFQDGDFAVGFDVENPSHDIEFYRCSARANLYTPSPYWNGDGFKTESETRNIRWIDCSAFDNGDGGFDVKTENAYLQNIIALRNNRNIRIWSSQKAILRNANASYAKHLGGIGTAAGIWSAGSFDCHGCTLRNNEIQVLTEGNGKDARARVRFYDSILSSDGRTQGDGIRQEKGTRVELIRTVRWKEGVAELGPQFGFGADARWEGGDREFNNLLYGKMKGYHYE